MEPVSWLDRLRLYMRQNLHDGAIEVWDDGKIGAGADWRAAIATAMDRSDGAVLLVGPGFLASDFVAAQELPRLIAAAQSRGLRIFPLVVKYCSYQRSVLGPLEAVNDPKKPLESLPTEEQNRILNQLAIDVDEAVRSQAAVRPPSRGKTDLIEVVRTIQQQLADNLTAFLAQVRRRDGLVSDLQERLQKRISLQYEKLFFRYYAELTPDERFEFDQIRAMTEGPLYQGNRRTLDLIERHPELLAEIPALLDLRQHLVFWLNKYERVFTRHPQMCLLYTGVEDAVPFPNHVDDEIADWLARHPAPSPRRRR